MKSFVPAVALAFCVLHPDLATAAVSLDPTTNVLTDSDAGRMWVLDGIGFCCSYAFPGFANDWVSGLNQQSFAGYADWRLPTVVAPTNGSAPPQASGELGQLFQSLTVAYADRNDWPFGLVATDYGGRIIYSDAPVPGLPANYWGLNFGDGEYKAVNVNNAYAWVGVMAVRPVPEPGTWALLLAGLGLIGACASRSNRETNGRSAPVGEPV